ncbi:MAG: YihY/virulence factor BrkB family protein, partial [Bryobacteraceae bacterium]
MAAALARIPGKDYSGVSASESFARATVWDLTPISREPFRFRESPEYIFARLAAMARNFQAAGQSNCLSVKMKILRRIATVLGETFSRWNAHNATSLGAAIAFYTLLSVAPLLIFLVAIVSIVFGRQPVEYRIVDAAHQIIGTSGAATIQSLLQSAHKPAEGFVASALAALALLFGASGVFTELRDALNRMWDVSTCDTSGIISLVKQRVFSFIMMLAVGLLLALSILAVEILG